MIGCLVLAFYLCNPNAYYGQGYAVQSQGYAYAQSQQYAQGPVYGPPYYPPAPQYYPQAQTYYPPQAYYPPPPPIVIPWVFWNGGWGWWHGGQWHGNGWGGHWHGGHR